MKWTVEEIKAHVSIESILTHYGAHLNGKGQGSCLFPTQHNHGDAHPSMSVRDGRAYCWAQGCFGDKGADIFEVVGLKEGLTHFPDQRRRVIEIAGLNGHAATNSRRIVKTYDYVDESGTLFFQVVRFEPKDFRQRRPDGQGGWIWSLHEGDGKEKRFAVRLVLYRLPDVVAAQSVLLLEGEKDVETAYRLGLPDGWAATCNPMGAEKWRSEYSEQLRGKHVRILPDRDPAGQRHAELIETALSGIAGSIRRAALPADAKDLSEWAEAGGTPATFFEFLNGKSISILDEVHTYLGRFIAYPSEHARVAHTLWIAHTHLMDKWESTPRIAFLSPEPGSGKTRALEITETLVPRPMQSINATAAALFRKVSDPKGPPTILYDEIDTIFGPKAKEHEDIRALINAGHRRGAFAHRCAVKGKQVELEEFPAYCAVALAGLGQLPDTILTRSIVARMRRRAPTENVEPYRHRLHAREGHQLRDRLAAWAVQMAPLLQVDPVMPPGIADRDADVWEALLSIADAVGGVWPELARVSAVTLVTDAKGDRGSLGVRLLTDLRTVFGDRDAMATTEILDSLINLDESPWGDLRGKPLDGRRLAKLLKPYGIAPKPVRCGASVFKGYERTGLHDAWIRYVPPESESPLALSPHIPVTSVTAVTDEDEEMLFREDGD
jgi:hypothetical protein